MKFKPYRKDQEMLFPSNVTDYVPASHLARVVDHVVEQLNTSAIENKYSHQGQHTYHPKILIKLLVNSKSCASLIISRKFFKRGW